MATFAEREALPRLGLLGQLLLRLSTTQRVDNQEPDPDVAVQSFESIVPGIVAMMRGSRVLDFGCGTGALAIGLARESCDVVGLDIQEPLLRRARTLASTCRTRVKFTDRLEGSQFDCIISMNSMEHFAEPLAVLRQMRSVLAPNGRIVVTFCPTWLSPYGAHMHFFTNVPWVHLIFPERTVLAVRARFVDDGATRYEEVTGGLNRMTVRRFFRLVHDAGLSIVSSRVDAVRGLPLVHVPILGELFANRVTAVLMKARLDSMDKKSLLAVSNGLR